MQSTVFDAVCEGIEAGSSLAKLEARGTVRIALKSAGLEAASITREQMITVLERLLPSELERRGVTDAAALCARTADQVRRLATESNGSESPESVFERIGGGK